MRPSAVKRAAALAHHRLAHSKRHAPRPAGWSLASQSINLLTSGTAADARHKQAPTVPATLPPSATRLYPARTWSSGTPSSSWQMTRPPFRCTAQTEGLLPSSHLVQRHALVQLADDADLKVVICELVLLHLPPAQHQQPGASKSSRQMRSRAAGQPPYAAACSIRSAK